MLYDLDMIAASVTVLPVLLFLSVFAVQDDLSKLLVDCSSNL